MVAACAIAVAKTTIAVAGKNEGRGRIFHAPFGLIICKTKRRENLPVNENTEWRSVVFDPLKTLKTQKKTRKKFSVFGVFGGSKQMFAGVTVRIQSKTRFTNESPTRSITVPNNSAKKH
ncbi:MAG: hypothetical protein JSS81_08480 [Acidobacteria bacterium]|nr:hypothetical protein [Acidobacteriota bacterium]